MPGADKSDSIERLAEPGRNLLSARRQRRRSHFIMAVTVPLPQPIFEEPRLPPGYSPEEIIAAMPWIRAWLRSPDASAPMAPRNFLHTPFALSLMRLPPHGGALLLAPPVPQTPPAVLRRLAHMLFFSQAPGLRRDEPLLASIGGGDPLAAVQAAITPAGLTAHGTHGQLPLTLAALLGRHDVVDSLLAAGAAIDGCDVMGNSAGHWAGIVGDATLGQRLQEAGADASQENIMGGRAGDYRAAWRRQAAAQPGIACQGRDGNIATPASREAFIADMGFEYLAEPRPGIDFFVHLLFGMWRPEWVMGVRNDILRLGHLPRQAPDMPRLSMKDFGDPWGWGVCTTDAIAAGSPVTTYVGDLVHTYEMLTDLVNWGFPAYTCNAMPNPAMQGRFMSMIDACRSGNLGSRINCSHTAEAANLVFTCRFWRGLPEVRFSARRNIAAHEQLSWFYGDPYWKERGVEVTPLPDF